MTENIARQIPGFEIDDVHFLKRTKGFTPAGPIWTLILETFTEKNTHADDFSQKGVGIAMHIGTQFNSAANLIHLQLVAGQPGLLRPGPLKIILGGKPSIHDDPNLVLCCAC